MEAPIGRLALAMSIAVAMLLAGCCSAPPSEKDTYILVGVRDSGAGTITVSISLRVNGSVSDTAVESVQLSETDFNTSNKVVKIKVDPGTYTMNITSSGDTGALLSLTVVIAEGPNMKSFLVKSAGIEEVTVPA